MLLAETFTLEPIAPAYRQGDPQWGAIVDWTVHALVQAEASGVTQANVAAMRDSADPAVQRLLGIDFAAGRALGLEHDWAARVIEAARQLRRDLRPHRGAGFADASAAGRQCAVDHRRADASAAGALNWRR